MSGKTAADTPVQRTPHGGAVVVTPTAESSPRVDSSDEVRSQPAPVNYDDPPPQQHYPHSGHEPPRQAYYSPPRPGSADPAAAYPPHQSYGGEYPASSQGQYRPPPPPLYVQQGCVTGVPAQAEPPREPSPRWVCVLTLVISLIAIVGCIICLSTTFISLTTPSNPQVQGSLYHFNCAIRLFAGKPIELSVYHWDQIPPLAKFMATFQFHVAVLIICILLLFYLVVIQILRLRKSIRIRQLYRHSTAACAVANAVLLVIGEIAVSVTNNNNIDLLVAWMAQVSGSQDITASMGGGYVALVLMTYIPSVVLFGFAIRTWVGPRCERTCCSCCGCNLAPEQPPLPPLPSGQVLVTAIPVGAAVP